MLRLHSDERGQALPLVVLFLLVLMGVVAMVLDGGYAFAQKRRMQNAADAGALAGALVIAKGETRDAAVRQAVGQYAQQNGAITTTMIYIDANGATLPNPANGFIPSDMAALRVTTQRPFPTFFARVLGLGTMTAGAQASAKAIAAAMPTELPGLAPISVPTNFYDVCATGVAHCDLWDSSYAAAWGLSPNQYKSLIDLSNGTAGGSTPQKVTTWTQQGYPDTIRVNNWFQTITGNYGNNVADALRQRFTAHPGGVDPDGVVWGTIDISVWDAINTSTLQVHVVKFGRFKIRMTDIFGSHTYGHFIDWVVPGHERGPDIPAGPSIIVLGG